MIWTVVILSFFQGTNYFYKRGQLIVLHSIKIFALNKEHFFIFGGHGDRQPHELIRTLV